MSKSNICIATLLLLLLTACGKKEMPSIQGQWYQEHDGWSESLYVYDDNFGYIEETMDGMELTGDYTKKTDNGFEFILEGEYPGSLTYDAASETLTFSVPGVLPDGADLVRKFSKVNFFDALASCSEIGDDRIIFSNPEMTEKLAEGGAGAAYQVKEITDDWCKIRVPVDATGYVSIEKFRYTKYIPTARIFDKVYEREDSIATTSYWFKRKGDDLAIYRNVLPTDGSNALEYYYGASIKGNVISVDRKVAGVKAFEEVDLSDASRLEEPFEIYVMETPYHTFLMIDGERYNQLPD